MSPIKFFKEINRVFAKAQGYGPYYDIKSFGEVMSDSKELDEVYSQVGGKRGIYKAATHEKTPRVEVEIVE